MTNYMFINFRNGVRTIKLHKPERKNAMCSSMYKTLTRILTEDAKNDNVIVTILTGSDSYFSSGNDMKAAMSENLSVEDNVNMINDLVTAFINYPKLLIAVVNGPAIGIGATMSALCDIVYASNKALFDAPFVKLGLCAEGASSFVFPFTLGRSKASEVLYLNHKLDAQEAYKFGLISKVIEHTHLDNFINDLHSYGNLPLNSIKNNKKLVMANLNTALHNANKNELNQLAECLVSEDFFNAATKFLGRKSKL